MYNYKLEKTSIKRCKMAVSYKKLWKMLIDKDMKKKDLAELADVSSYTITKMSKGENVTTDTLGKICKVLGCNVEDIMEFIPEE
jgi:DNA-binding Xre family transcriptional regulator